MQFASELPSLIILDENYDVVQADGRSVIKYDKDGQVEHNIVGLL